MKIAPFLTMKKQTKVCSILPKKMKNTKKIKKPTKQHFCKNLRTKTTSISLIVH